MPTLLKVPAPQATGSGVQGSLRSWYGDYFGNNNYQAGGDKTLAQDWGMSGILFFDTQSQKSSSGNYSVVVFPPANSSNSSESSASAYSSVTLKWYYAANSVEVANNTNLSAESLRLEVRGV